MITARRILAIKSNEEKEERYRVRYVSSVHLDVMKDCIVHGAHTIQCVSVCIILVLAKTKAFRIFLFDVKIAYLHSDKST